jgi:hypothetical protein
MAGGYVVEAHRILVCRAPFSEIRTILLGENGGFRGAGIRGKIDTMVFSPSGQYLAVMGSPNSMLPAIVVIDCAKAEVVWRHDKDEHLSGIGWRDDVRLCLIRGAGEQRQVVECVMPGGRVSTKPSTTLVEVSFCGDALVDPTGRYIAENGPESGLSFWDIRQGVQRLASKPPGKLAAVSWDPNGKKAFCIRLSPGGPLRAELVDLESMQTAELSKDLHFAEDALVLERACRTSQLNGFVLHPSLWKMRDGVSLESKQLAWIRKIRLPGWVASTFGESRNAAIGLDMEAVGKAWWWGASPDGSLVACVERNGLVKVMKGH